MRKWGNFSFLSFFIYSLILVFSLSCVATIPKDINPENESIIVGCIEGTIIAKEGDLWQAHSQSSPEWKLEGFEIYNEGTKKTKRLSINKNGYFLLVVEDGSYVLRKKSSPYGKRKTKKKYLTIKTFKVGYGEVYNLGTYKLDYEKPGRGTIAPTVVRWRIKHISTVESYMKTLYWFQVKYPEVFFKFRNRIDSTDLDKLEKYEPPDLPPVKGPH